MEVAIGIAIVTLVVSGICGVFSEEKKSSSATSISQIVSEPRKAMRKASDDYLSNVRDITRR